MKKKIIAFLLIRAMALSFALATSTQIVLMEKILILI